MKKRVIAMLAMLALAVSLSVSMVSASTPATYDVGYAKVDINPYKDTDGDGIISDAEREAGALLGLPMGGYDDTSTRLSNGKVDDNGDGKVDENDGLFATCIAVTDKSGKTALLFNLDMLSAYTEYVSRVRNILLSDEYFAEFGLTADRILFNGSHSHNTPQMTSGFSNSEYSFAEDYVTYRTLLVDQLVNAAKLALADRAPATMYKGTIDASDSNAAKSDIGDTLNTLRADAVEAGEAENVAVLSGSSYLDREYNAVRHYKVTAQETDSNGNALAGGETIQYVAGSAFNGDYEGVGTEKTSTDSAGNTRYWKITGYQEVSKADDKMHILEFRFEAPDKDPIALINWRCHLIGLSNKKTTNTYWKVSSSQIGSLRYTLEQAGYRAAYFQGAAGNVVSYSYLSPGSWMRSSATNHADNRHNIYGTELAEVALELLNSDNMTQINENGGEINGLQSFYQTERKTVSVFEYLAGLQYKIAYYNDEGGGNRTYNGLYYYTDAEGTPLISTTASVTDTGSAAKVVDYADVTQTNGAKKKTAFTVEDEVIGLTHSLSEDEKALELITSDTKVTQEKAVVITSIYHANHLVDGYLANGTAGQEIELYALTIGDGFSLVAASGEPFDRYSDDITYDEDGLLDGNKWDEVGADFVMGYTNNGTGYLGSKATFSFSEDAEQYGFAVGTYETLRNPFVAGEGEKMLDQLGLMLDLLKGGESVTTEEGYCAHCQKYAIWTALDQNEMENGELSLTSVLAAGHYYLAEDITFDDKETMEGAEVCLDLNGCTLTTLKSVEVKANSTFNLLGDGTVVGYEAPKEGGVFNVASTATMNQYGGTLRYEGEAYSGNYGDGGIYFINGTLNVYDGQITGTTVTYAGGAMYVNSTGRANFYGGKVTSGSATYGACIGCFGTVQLSGDAYVQGIHYLGSSVSDTDSIAFTGKFTGYVQISGLNKNVDVGDNDNADISCAYIKMYSGADSNTYMLRLVGSDVYVMDTATYTTMDAEGNYVYTDDFAQAVSSAADGAKVTLLKNVTADVTVAEDTQLELNGKKITGTVTVNENVTLQVTDIATADYDLTKDACGRTYGQIKVAGSGTVEGKPATDDNDVYLMLEETDGYVSFHAVDLNINIMSLKPEVQGVYYNHEFVADESVTNLVKGDGCYGIALSLTEAALEDAALQEQLIATEDVEAEGCVVKGESVVLTRFTGNFGSSISTSTIVTGIMKEENGYTTNRRTSKTPICGRAYVRLDDGTYLMGATRKLTLQELVEAFDDKWSKLSSAQQNNLLRMYKTNAYYKVMRYWDIPNIKNPT